MLVEVEPSLTSKTEGLKQLDPEQLFSYKYDRARNAALASGGIVPKFVYEYIPKSIVRSIALAIDPFSKFRVAQVQTTPVNRTRTRLLSSVLNQYGYKWDRYAVSNDWIYTQIGTPPCVRVDGRYDASGSYTFNYGVIPDIERTIKDTTAKTRPKGSDYGHLERFEMKVFSPPRISVATERVETRVLFTVGNTCGGLSNGSNFIDRKTESDLGSAARLPYDIRTQVYDQELADLESIMSDKALKMLPKAVPSARRYSLFRSLGELKDLPRSVVSLRSTLADLEKFVKSVPLKDQRFITDLSQNVANIPREYVSYHFGWKQLYKDINDLLDFPAKAARDVNRLIERNGKPTSYSVGEKYNLPSKSYPAFSYIQFDNERNIKMEHDCQRSIELRMVVNAIFKFPDIAVPELRRDLFRQKLGVIPSVTDFYNLTPWTWLIDWFTGLGDYVHAMDAINTDSSTINYGFLTGKISGKITTTRSWRTRSNFARWNNIDGWSDVETFQPYTHTSRAEYFLVVRKDIASAYGAKSTLELPSLTDYQKSIVGAIGLDRSGVRKLAKGG